MLPQDDHLEFNCRLVVSILLVDLKVVMLVGLEVVVQQQDHLGFGYRLVASILLAELEVVMMVELDLMEEVVVLRLEEELVVLQLQVLKLLELVLHRFLVRLKNEEL